MPTLSIHDKRCKKCNVLLSEENEAKGKKNHCKPCYNAYMRTMFQKHKDKHREIMYAWRKKNKDKVKKMLVENAVKKHGSLSKSVGHYLKKYNKEVTDTYLKHLLTKSRKCILKHSDIPQDLIELKRKAVLLKRQIN